MVKMLEEFTGRRGALFSLALVFLLVGAVGGCEEEAETRECVPGDVEDCVCDEGGPGTRTCYGVAVFGPCACLPEGGGEGEGEGEKKVDGNCPYDPNTEGSPCSDPACDADPNSLDCKTASAIYCRAHGDDPGCALQAEQVGKCRFNHSNPGSPCTNPDCLDNFYSQDCQAAVEIYCADHDEEEACVPCIGGDGEGESHVGDYSVTDQAGADALATFCEVTGDLFINAPNIASLSLPLLKKVGGSLEVYENPALGALELPIFRVLGGSLDIRDNPVLETLEIPEILQLRDHLNVWFNPSLSALTLPALEGVGCHLVVGSNEGLTTISLPNINYVGCDLYIYGNLALPQCLADGVVAELQSGGTIRGFFGDTTFCNAWGECNNTTCTCEIVDGALEAECP